MKITKIPGLGRFGVFIDDLDFNNVSDEEWMEIGRLHLESLVTIIRNINTTPAHYEQQIKKWGSPRRNSDYNLLKKYNTTNIGEIVLNDVVNGKPVDEQDKKFFEEVRRIIPVEEAGPGTDMLRVSGRKDENGNPLGMFAEGELLWHSNESGNLVFAPGVSLLGAEGVVGSATGFVTTPDWYEEQSESFRSELDEMVIQHTFTHGRINPGLRPEQDELMYRNMCPFDIELPLVIQSPIGFKGLHYSVNTIDGIVGMTKEESDAVFKQINETLFVEKYIYDHWYQQDNDLCLFDNSVTLHRRLGGVANRLCYRIQYDYGKIAPNNQPYLKDPWKTLFSKELIDINNALGIK